MSYYIFEPDIPLIRQQFPNLLGRGVAYPFRETETGGVLMAEGEDLIEMSVAQIVTTSVGEGVYAFFVRNGVPFGTYLTRYKYESTDQVRQLAKYELPRAIDTWEPRVRTGAIYVSDSEGRQDEDTRKVLIRIGYQIRATGGEQNLVVPWTMRRV